MNAATRRENSSIGVGSGEGESNSGETVGLSGGMPPIRWFEPALVLAAAIVHAIWSSMQMADHWFINDYWAHLGNAGLSVDDLLEGHGGHLGVFNVLVSNTLTDWFGLQYWPAFGILRAVAWAALGMWAWWSTRKLGSEPIVAIAAAILILTFGGAYWFKPWLINIVLGPFMWVTTSILIGGEQTNRRRVVLTAVLMVGIASSSQTPLFAIAAVMYCVTVRRMRFWLPPLLASLAIWVFWSAAFSPNSTAGEDLEWSFRKLLSVPYLMLEILANTVARFADVSNQLAALFLIGVGSAFAYRLFSKKPISSHAAISGLFMLVIAGATTVNRVLPGTSGTDAVRYVLFAVPMIFAFAPSIRFPRRPNYRVASILLLTAIVGYLATVNLEQSTVGYDFDTARSAQSEELANTIGYLIANDVAYRPQQLLRPEAPGAGLMRFSQLADLISDGWQPEPVPSLLGKAHSIMVLAPGEAGNAPSVCSGIAGLTEIKGTDFWIIGEPLDKVTLTWDTPIGTYEDDAFLGPNGELHLSIIEPRTSKLYVDQPASGLRVCDS